MIRVRSLAVLTLITGCTAVVPDDSATSDGGTDRVMLGATIPPASAPIEDMLAWLADQLPARSPGSDLSIAFEDLQTGARAAIGGDVLHVSASSAKAWWVAAALDGAGSAAVMPYADAIFRNSDNSASGRVIDLIGPNAVNTWMWDVGGMSSSALTQWSFDRTRIATNSPRAMGGDNYMTADDAVTFLSRLYRKELLADERGGLLLSWLTLSPNAGLGGWIPGRLPPDVQLTTMHKAGWLPPGCCSDNTYYNTSNDIGIVVAPDGRAFAIAILARRGTDYTNHQTRYVELASCLVYRTFAQDGTLDCTRADDPAGW